MLWNLFRHSSFEFRHSCIRHHVSRLTDTLARATEGPRSDSRRHRVGLFCFGPILSATSLPAWARLGPFSRSNAVTRCFRQTVDRDRFRRDRSPNGVAQRFPDWTAVGFAFPSPFLGSHSSHSPLQWPPSRGMRHCNEIWVVLGSTHHQPIDSLDAARCITCGDVNPDCFMRLFFSPLVSGGLGYRNPRNRQLAGQKGHFVTSPHATDAAARGAACAVFRL